MLFGHILTFLSTLDIQAPSRQLGMKFLDPKPLQIASYVLGKVKNFQGRSVGKFFKI